MNCGALTTHAGNARASRQRASRQRPPYSRCTTRLRPAKPSGHHPSNGVLLAAAADIHLGFTHGARDQRPTLIAEHRATMLIEPFFEGTERSAGRTTAVDRVLLVWSGSVETAAWPARRFVVKQERDRRRKDEEVKVMNTHSSSARSPETRGPWPCWQLCGSATSPPPLPPPPPPPPLPSPASAASSASTAAPSPFAAPGGAAAAAARSRGVRSRCCSCVLCCAS